MAVPGAGPTLQSKQKGAGTAGEGSPRVGLPQETEATIPLHHEDQRPDALSRIRAALTHLRSRPSGVPDFLRKGPLHDLATAAPHGVYDIGVDDLASGKGLSAARRTGWRCLLVDDSGSVASAELTGESGSDGSDAIVTVGPFALAMEAAIRIAEALPEVVVGNFEVRFLRIAALHFGAVWLKSGTEGGDLVLPLPPSPLGLAPRPYRIEELLPILQQAAVRKETHRYHP